MKRLRFGINKKTNKAAKCHQLHVGKQSEFCPQLKAHTVIIDKVDEDKYLGDIINSQGKLTRNIEARVSKGIGVISQIMSILNEISLGKHYFEMAILFRNCLFINSVLFNSEVWYPVSAAEVNELSKVDKMLMRRILDAPHGTPTELLYLETGCVPIQHIIKCRRIVYLHYLITLDKEQLLSKFFHAQKRNPTKGDWVQIVKQDLVDFGIEENFEKIGQMKKEKFKEIVIKACKKISFDKLVKEKANHSKGQNLVFKDLKMSTYL